MATFHQFTLLPAELRLAIWELTIDPRTIEIHKIDTSVATAPPGTRLSAPRLVSPTPIPAIVHVCHEYRNLGLYHKSLSELGFKDGAEPWYIWADLTIDTLSITAGETPLSVFKPIATSVTFVKIERLISSGLYYWGDTVDGVFQKSQHVEELRDFVNLKKIHIINTDDVRIWHGDRPVQNVLAVRHGDDRVSHRHEGWRR
ncbi:hypothetical protein T440DRAFT_194607 [Plenodomus tracheiphilus IPT5]|uniref:2EXR domain-containing protein n=1 Tax=Plenodomus tracheiphilus IPT5 TaxID=1408161 RepID=A0A6A7AWQ0_9PLEO|nr:hypothetical protein T440DRAFT_194607 [Plenodomus tracheiphilus IPT5]